MASRKDTGKKSKKEDKPSLGRRIKNFFSDIRAELKRVTWPDRKRLKANTGTVIAIILTTTLIIFVFDTIISSVLSGTGFYTYEKETQITETVEEDTESTTEADTESETEATTDKTDE